MDGALSVGKTTSREFSHHHAVFNAVTTTLDDEERRIRPKLRHAQDIEVGSGEAADMTGFLLRSQAVTFYPGLEVKAYRGEEDDKQPLRLLRMDRPGPDVLLCLFDGVPDIVDIEEPREGIQFGVDINLDENQNIEGSADNPSGFTLKVRHVQGSHAGFEVGWINRDISDDPIDDIPERYEVSVPVREANPQVLHIEALRTALDQTMDNIKATHGAKFPYDGDIGPAELGVEMLQFPFHQRFYGDGRPRPLDTMPEFQLKTQYSGATVGAATSIPALSEAEINALISAGFEEDDT